MQSATQQILEQAEPIAKDITRGVIAPGATEIRKNAVPITEEVCLLNQVLLSGCLAPGCTGSCDLRLWSDVGPGNGLHSISSSVHIIWRSHESRTALRQFSTPSEEKYA